MPPPIAVLTRPAGRNGALAQHLASAGWQVLLLPALIIEPLPDTGPPPRPQDFDLVVFVSGNAARLYFDSLAAHGLLLPGGWPGSTLAATVGQASAQALRASPLFGARARLLHPSADAPAHDSEALWQLLSAGPLPRRALLVRGTQGRDWLAERLAEAGASVRVHAMYRRRPAGWPAEAQAQLRRWAADSIHPAWLLTSGEGIDAVAAAARAAGVFEWWAQCRFVVTHPRLEKHLLAVAGAPGQTGRVKTSMPADEAIFEAILAA